MKAFRSIASIPVLYRVPVLVALLVIVVSAIISERVLDRLSRTQQAYLDALAATYLDGLSSATLPGVLRNDVWEVFDALDRSKASYEALAPVETVVTGEDGNVLAATDPARIPSYSRLPAEYGDRFIGNAVTIEESSMTGYVRRDLLYRGQTVGAIYAVFDVSHLFAERREVFMTLLVTNAVLAVLFALGGFLLVRRMVEPMLVLERHMLSAAQGVARPIAPSQFPSRDPEAERLFNGYNSLVEAEQERAQFALRLAEEERIASLGRLASGMAHEINNPLGGLLNAVDTLRRHGATPSVRDTSVSLIERGLNGIRDVVKAALATYRPDSVDRPLYARDIDDVRLLMRPEVARRRQRLNWTVNWNDSDGSSFGPVRQAVLNLLLNASAATPEYGQIELTATAAGGRLLIEIGDEGTGMPEDIAGILTSAQPGAAVRPGRGLGLWMVRRVVDDAKGEIRVARKESGGTRVTLDLPLVGEELTSDVA